MVSKYLWLNKGFCKMTLNFQFCYASSKFLCLPNITIGVLLRVDIQFYDRIWRCWGIACMKFSKFRGLCSNLYHHFKISATFSTIKFDIKRDLSNYIINPDIFSVFRQDIHHIHFLLGKKMLLWGENLIWIRERIIT